MSIYKSSFKKNKSEEKNKNLKAEKIKHTGKSVKHTNVNSVLISTFVLLLFVCILPSNFIKSFLLGCFGLLIYPLLSIGIIYESLKLKKKKVKSNKKYTAFLICALFLVWFIFHLVLTSKISLLNFKDYLVDVYQSKVTGGGVLFGLLSYPMTKYFTVVGAYITSAVFLAIDIGFIVDYLTVERYQTSVFSKPSLEFEDIEDFAMADAKQIEYDKREKLKNEAKQKLGLTKNQATIISSSMPIYDYDVDVKQEKIKRDKEFNLSPLEPIINGGKTDEIFEEENNHNGLAEEITPKATEEIMSENDDVFVSDDETEGFATAFETDAENDFNKGQAKEIDAEDLDYQNDNDELHDIVDLAVENEDIEEEIVNLKTDLSSDYIDEYAFNKTCDLGETVDKKAEKVDLSKFNLPNINKDITDEQVVDDKPELQAIPPYVVPPVELLHYMENSISITEEELQDNVDRLEQVLNDFKVPAKVNNVKVGPAVTRYELTMPRGISVNRIAQMSDDIAMTLASNGKIRVEAPIPGKTSVGVEVPNRQITPVSLRELIDSDAFKNRANPLSFVLGKDINGDIIFCNLDKMPHVLIAGSTGSGKSVCLNTMLLSMCYKCGPQDLRLILIDPKMVEFTIYNGLPHLLIPEVITNKTMAINALDWAIGEMERRYVMFAKQHFVNINEYNRSEFVKSNPTEKLPYIVIVVDELADLMLEAKREIDDRISKLAAKARAAGIHLVLATQRPSVDVITGTVKANLPSRIAFALTNFMDSKTVLDGSGAEKLLGKGDMLFKPQDKPEALRVQGAFVSNQEIAEVVEFIKLHNHPVFNKNACTLIKNAKRDGQSGGNLNLEKDLEYDPVLKDALRMFIQTKQASGSMITRRYSVGFSRAGRIMDQMERSGFVGPQDGSKPRQVLITMEEFNAIFGDNNN